MFDAPHPARCTWTNLVRLAQLALVFSVPLSAHANMETPAPVVQSHAYRCGTPGGVMQYQQMPCGDTRDSQARLIRVADQRTTDQRQVADRMADRDQDLASEMAKHRQLQARQALKTTGAPRSLTIAPKPKVQTALASTTALKVPRKRDFRAVATQTEADSTNTRRPRSKKIRNSSDQPV